MTSICRIACVGLSFLLTACLSVEPMLPADLQKETVGATDELGPEVTQSTDSVSVSDGSGVEVASEDTEASDLAVEIVHFDVEDTELLPDEICTPDCEGRECGDDGCGGGCGECNQFPNSQCAEHQCACISSTPCQTDPPRECGSFDDGCGNDVVCGTCNSLQQCSDDGLCDCLYEKCSEKCCPEGTTCYQGACCTPDCLEPESMQPYQCGPDGCGGSCGECVGGALCHVGSCVEDCTDTCFELEWECSIVCGEICGECGPSSLCEFGECVYYPSCGNGICDTDEDNQNCPEDCPCAGDGWVYHSGAESLCYKAFSEGRTWTSAAASCQSKGGNLMRVTSDNQELLADPQIGLLADWPLWIGLRWEQTCHEHCDIHTQSECRYLRWTWVAAGCIQNSDWTNVADPWAEQEPDNDISDPFAGCGLDAAYWCSTTEQCAGVGGDGKWQNRPCNEMHGYVCQRPPNGSGSQP